MSKSQPWYDRFNEYFIQGLSFILSLDHWKNRPPESIFTNFQRETLARFIFESNNIEREGLTFGETKKLVLYDFESIPQVKELSYVREVSEMFKDIDMPVDLKFLLKTGIKPDSPADIEETLKTASVKLVAKYGSHSKEALTVVKHYIAILRSDILVEKYNRSRQIKLLFNIKKSIKDINSIGYIDKILSRYNLDPDIEPEYLDLITIENIKMLHKIMAENLIDPSLSPAGEFRNHPIMTDLESHYPAPEVVPQSIEKYVSDFNNLLNTNLNPISLSAWASTMFVLIHPFSDFNGRLSRLIMNMVLRTYNVPFWVSIRSNQKDKRRYFTSLIHYRRSKKTSINTLISMQICDNFENLNEQLLVANYPQMPIKELPPKIINLPNAKLLKLKCPISFNDED
jgi:fido (protein-threonine AMPylation protein)